MIATVLFPVPPPAHCGGPGAFSPTLPIGRVSPEDDHDTGLSTVFGDSTWTAPPAAVDPTMAMYHSLAIPGWGQLNNGKKKKAALFFIAETVCIGGFIYMSHRVHHDDVEDWERDNLRTDRNTFLIYFLGAKVLDIVDAYVDAHLAGFDVEDITPEEIETSDDVQ